MAQVWTLLKTVEKAIVELSKYVDVQPIGYLPNAVLPIVSQNKALTKQYEDIKLVQLKLHYLHQTLNQAQADQIQTFIQWAEEVKRQASDGWRLQLEKALQLELLQRHQLLQRELVTAQRQALLRSETQKKLQPIGLVAANIFDAHDDSAIIPLRVFWVPPQLQLERAATAQGLNIELTLAESLRQFFRKYSIADRPIDFLSGAWISQPHSEARVKSLFNDLRLEPTLMLESEANGDFLNFRLACWGWSKYRYEPVISRLPYREILNQSAKARAEKWLETREKLIAAGENLEEIDALYGGDNPENLETWQREQKCRRVGIDIDEIEFNYSVNQQDIEHLCQFLALYQCLFAGLVIDEYFLVQYNVPPLLPRLLADLTVNVPDSAVKSITQAVVSYYQNLYQLLDQRSLMPELSLDLAQSLMNLPDLAWAKQQIINSVKCWLKLRNLEQPDGLHALLEKLSLALAKEDEPYIERLNSCLAAVDVSVSLSVEQACYKRGIICFQEENYKAAIFEFDQVIQLKPNWAEVYYSRGLAHNILEHYQEAIADYTQALQLNEQCKEVYYSRGNAYYRLGAHFKAIADYERALNIAPDFEKAKSQRALVQEVIKSLKHKRRQERVYKHWVDNLAVKKILIGHAQSVGCLAVSPDGDILASGSSDRTVKLWELDTGTEIRTLTGHFGEVEAITISPDGDILASGSDDTTVRLWELKTGRELCRLDHPHKVRSLTFSPDGRILASGLDSGIIKLWELKTGKEPRTLKSHSGGVRCLTFSPNGQILASGSTDRTVKLWHVPQGTRALTLHDHLHAVNSIAFSPDGQTLFRGSYDDIIKRWQLDKQHESLPLKGHTNGIYALAISPDGQTLVSSSADQTIKIWQLNTDEAVRTFTNHSQTVLAILFCPDGRTLISSSADTTIKIWRSL